MEYLNTHIARRVELITRYADQAGDEHCRITSVRARVVTERRKGIHRVRIRDLQVSTGPLADPEDQSPPAPPELQVGILGSALAHSYLVEADLLRLGIDSLEIDVEWRVASQTAGSWAGRQSPPRISYVVRIASPASEGEIARLAVQAEKSCSALDCLRNDQTILGIVEHLSIVAIGVRRPITTEGIAYG